jgi:meiosis induction protein kinase IME2/SME1
MAVLHDFPSRMAAGVMPTTCLEDKFEVIKEVGDGSFGSVHLARVRTAGAHIAKRGTMVRLFFFLLWEICSLIY